MTRKKVNPNQLLTLDCKNQEQVVLLRALKNNNYVFATGPAGTGKTFVATHYCLSQLVKGKFDKLYLARSVKNIRGEMLGYSPGDIAEKLHEYLLPVTENINKFIKQDYRKCDLYDKIEYVSLGKIRGRSIESSALIVDEAQSLSLELFTAILTRIDSNSLVVFCGDFEQSDVVEPVFESVASALDGMDSFAWIGLRESVRNPIITEILDRLKPLNDQRNIRGSRD